MQEKKEKSKEKFIKNKNNQSDLSNKKYISKIITNINQMKFITWQKIVWIIEKKLLV